MTISPAIQAHRPWTREPAAVIHDLDVDPSVGLSPDEAAARLAAEGPNELQASAKEPLWRKIVRQFQDALVYLLLVAMVISLAAWLVEGAVGFPVDVVVIGAIVLANAIIGLVQENKADSAVAALADMTRSTATVLRGGETRSVPSAEVVRGDVLTLAEGDSVAADARLLSATNLTVQESSLTGESEATVKDPQSLTGKVPLADRSNMVFKGTAVVQGVGRAVVTGTGMGTEMGSIAQLLADTEQEPSPLQREIAQVSRVLGGLVIGIAVVVMVALILINGVSNVQDLVDVLLLGVSLAVAAVPEGLPAILSLVLAIGVQAMARRNAVMKNLQSAETLGSASVICSDKTGTLTRNEMTLRRVVTASGATDIGGIGYAPEGTVSATSESARYEAGLALLGGTIANNAELHGDDAQGWSIQGDPTEGAFLVAQRKLDPTEPAPSFQRSAEVPFSSVRKMMSVAGRAPGGKPRLYSKGAPDVLLQHCTHEQVAESSRELTQTRRDDILATIDQLSGDGFRTLGVAWKPLADDTSVDDSAETDLIFVGVVAIIDPPRDEAAAAIAEAHRAGIRTVMITGDHPQTAARIAADLGIVPPGSTALTGADLDELSDDEFQDATRTTSVYARVAPEHKLRIVDALQADRQVVAMTGDGVNDAPALKSSDIGVAMGITGTEVTKEAATMILADDNYATIVAAVRRGRAIFDNIRKFLRYLLSSNMGEVITVFFGVVLASFIGLSDASAGVALPLLATQILWINLITDSGPALAMGVDPPDGDLMARRPRRPEDRIIDRDMWLRVGYIGVVMGAVTLLTIDMFLPGGLIEGSDSLDVARTAGFTTLVFAQLFNAFNARSSRHSAFAHMFTNRWLWGSVLLAAALQVAVVEVPFLQSAFGTASLDLQHWLAAIGMSSIVLWAEELTKLVRRLIPPRPTREAVAAEGSGKLGT